MLISDKKKDNFVFLVEIKIMCAVRTTEDRNRNGYVTVFNPTTETYQLGVEKPKGMIL